MKFLVVVSSPSIYQIRQLGGHHPHGKGPGGFSGTCDETADGAAPAVETLWEVDVHLDGYGNGGGGVPADGGIHSAMPEHSCTVNHYAITVRPV